MKRKNNIPKDISSMLLPCPVCDQTPPVVGWAGDIIIRCSHKELPQIGTGCWRQRDIAVKNWNEGVKNLHPVLEGEIYPCPICGEQPRVREFSQNWYDVDCDQGHIFTFLFGGSHGPDKETAIAAWNKAVEQIAKSKSKEKAQKETSC